MIRRKPEELKYEHLKGLYNKLRKKQERIKTKVEKLEKKEKEEK